MEANGSSWEAYREGETVQKLFGAVKISLEVSRLMYHVLGFKFNVLCYCTPSLKKRVL